MAIRTIDVDALAQQTGNLYEAIAILAKRARQISTMNKNELDEKLSYYEGFETEMEDPRFQEEQARISVEFEARPEPTEIAVNEMFDHEVYWRDPNDESETDSF